MVESFEIGPLGPHRRPTPEQNPQDINGEVVGSNRNVQPVPDHVDRTDSGNVHQQRPLSPVPAVPLPARPLTVWDVASLITNKMIGSGIFSAPPTVLLMARSPGLAFGLWIIGFAYTIISMLVYLEFARKLPHTGGELIYLDETLPLPIFMAYTIYTFYFVIIYNNATNSLRFADYVWRCATEPGAVEDQRFLRFLAVVILTFFCVLHFRSARMARALNVALAGFKIVMLLVVFVAGAIHASQQHISWSGNPSNEPSSTAAAFLLILFSFSGWENATFVSGEIRSHNVLRLGFIAAVSTVGILYLLVNIVFLSAVAYSPSIETNYVPIFFGDTPASQRGWDILIAISASGSLLSVIYTAARVKQAIGKSNALPWSRLWSLESPYKTPEGGLMLHWLFTVILICVTAAINNLGEAISFPGSVQAYATGFVGMLIGTGFLFLDKDSIPGPTRVPGEPPWTIGVGFFHTVGRRRCLSTIYIIFNLYIFVVTFLPPYRNPDGSERDIKGWVYPAAVGGTVVAGLLYYCAAFWSREKSVFRLANAKAIIHSEETHDAIYGCRRYVIVTPDNPRNPSLLYRLFGGRFTGKED